MIASVDMNDRTRDRWLLLVLALFVAFGLYLGAYIATCIKVVAPPAPGPKSAGPPGSPSLEWVYDGPAEYEAGYKLPACLNSAAAERVCEQVFSPLYTLDRYFRPGFWETPILSEKAIKALEEYVKRTRGSPGSAHP